jgi:hypothetical protein
VVVPIVTVLSERGTKLIARRLRCIGCGERRGFYRKPAPARSLKSSARRTYPRSVSMLLWQLPSISLNVDAPRREAQALAPYPGRHCDIGGWIGDERLS